MIKLKKKYGVLIPCLCLVFIILFTSVSYRNLKTHYDKEKKYPVDNKSYEEDLKNENIRARKKEETPLGDIKLNSLSAILMDADNRRVLYEKNGYEKRSMASTTKIMTCLVTLENANLDDVVTVSSYAAKMPDVQLNAREGEQYYLKDLLYSLMLESHNDVAVAIAERVGGTVEGFATMMNDRARSLNCMSTNFVTSNGLDAEGHYSTAEDLARIAAYAITNEQFIKITNASTHTFSEIKTGRTHTVSNKNKFLYMMDGAIGVKTGFTNKAGYCFVGAIKRSDRTLISVVLGCGWPPSRNLKWTDTKRLMEYGIKNYQLKQIFQPVDLDPIYVEDGQIPYENLIIKGDMEILLHKNETVNVDYDLPKVLIAPVEKNQVVGYANYYINNTPYCEIPIYAENDIKKIDFSFCFRKIIQLWTAIY